MKRAEWEKQIKELKNGQPVEIEYQTGMSKGQKNRKAEYLNIKIKCPCYWGDRIVENTNFGTNYYNYRRVKKITVLK